jgi:hypothetical protein
MLDVHKTDHPSTVAPTEMTGPQRAKRALPPRSQSLLERLREASGRIVIARQLKVLRFVSARQKDSNRSCESRYTCQRQQHR